MSTAIQVDFQAGKSLIPTIVRRQNSTLPKACIELVLNEIDAGAKDIKIVITHDEADKKTIHISIWGNGRGLPDDLDELKATFAKLGVDESSSGDDRAFGEFHMGRTQIANFGKVNWFSQGYKVECDLNALMGVTITECESPIKGGTLVTATVSDDHYPYSAERLTSELQSACRLVTKAKLSFNGEPMEPAKVAWNKVTPNYSIAVELGSDRSGWLIFHHGIFVNCISNTGFEEPVIINFTSRVRTTINRAEIMRDDPTWIAAESETNQILDRVLAVSRKKVRPNNIKALWRRLLAGKISVAAMKNLTCMRAVNQDLLTMADTHDFANGVVALMEKSSYYSEFLYRSRRAMPISLSQFTEYEEAAALAELNLVAEKLNLKFSLYDPAAVFIPSIGGEVDMEQLLQTVKASKRQRDKLEQLQNAFATAIRAIQSEIHLKLFWYTSSRDLPVIVLIDYPGVQQPVFTDQVKTIFVSLSYFTKIRLRTPDQVIPLIDQVVRAWFSLLAIEAAERFDGDTEDLVSSAMAAVYAPILSSVLTRLMTKE